MHQFKQVCNYVPPPQDIYIYYMVSPSPKGVSASAAVCIYARLCLRNISYRFSPVALKFLDTVTMGKSLN